MRYVGQQSVELGAKMILVEYSIVPTVGEYVIPLRQDTSNE